MTGSELQYHEKWIKRGFYRLQYLVKIEKNFPREFYCPSTICLCKGGSVVYQESWFTKHKNEEFKVEQEGSFVVDALAHDVKTEKSDLLQADDKHDQLEQQWGEYNQWKKQDIEQEKSSQHEILTILTDELHFLTENKESVSMPISTNLLLLQDNKQERGEKEEEPTIWFDKLPSFVEQD